jgi:hypothetical protein
MDFCLLPASVINSCLCPFGSGFAGVKKKNDLSYGFHGQFSDMVYLGRVFS